MRIFLSFILALVLSGPSWAYLTAGKVAVTATSSSAGTPSTSQDSDISDTVGVSVAVGVPVSVTGNVNITGNYQVNGTPISATSNWSQGSGSTINYTAGNVGIGSITPGAVLDITGGARASNGFNAPYIKISNTQSSGSNGGNSTTGSFQVMPMNTKDNDTTGIASLCTGNGAPVVTCTASGQLVLPAGIYIVHASSPFVATGKTQIRIYNVTGSAVLVNGQTSNVIAANSARCFASLSGQFTLSSTSAIAFQYETTTNTGTTDLGDASSFGTEVYAIAEFIKVQ